VTTYQAAPDNGMHPTRDTNTLIFEQGGRRAGDAGRSALAEGVGRKSLVKAGKGKDYLR